MKNYVKISCSVLFKMGLNVSVGRTAEDILATCDSVLHSTEPFYLVCCFSACSKYTFH